MADGPMTIVFVGALVALVSPTALSLWKYIRRAAPSDRRLVVSVADEETSFKPKSFNMADVKRLEALAETVRQLQTIR